MSNRSITIRNRDGEKIPISISAAPLADHGGKIIGGVETFRDLSALTALRNQLKRKYHFEEIVSNSKAMQRLFTIMPEIDRSLSTVPIYGESGTGKELIARALYNLSDRQDQPFIALNCGAPPNNNLSGNHSASEPELLRMLKKTRKAVSPRPGETHCFLMKQAIFL